MGYFPPDVEDLPTDELISLQTKILAIIAERERLISAGLCPYCKQPLTNHTCRYKGRVFKFHNYMKE